MLCVELVRSFIPSVAHCVDVEGRGAAVLYYIQLAGGGWFSEIGVLHFALFEHCFGLFQVVVGNLKHNRRVFGKQNLYCVIFCKSVERDLEPAFLVGKTHLMQAGNKTTGRYVMPRQHDSFFN